MVKRKRKSSLLKKVLKRNFKRKIRKRGRHPLHRHLPFFRGLVRASQSGGGKSTKVLKKAKQSQIKAVHNTFYNLLKGNIPLPEKDRIYIKKHRVYIRKIANKRGLAKNKRKLLIKQAGGFLPGLIAALVPTLISTITSLAR